MYEVIINLKFKKKKASTIIATFGLPMSMFFFFKLIVERKIHKN